MISYDAAGNISGLGLGTVMVVLNESDVDAIVTSIGLDDGSGGLVTTIGDLQALDIDPAGGTFIGADLITKWPDRAASGRAPRAGTSSRAPRAAPAATDRP